MMRVLPVLLLAIPALAWPAPYAHYFDMTGEQFVKIMSSPNPTGDAYLQREKAYSYLDGIKDATIGHAWCPPRPRKTFELAYDAVDHIKTLPAGQRKGNAATLLLEFLTREYPCKGARP